MLLTDPAPLDALPLFRPLLAELIALLRGLDAEQWLRPTLAPAWRVRDIAAHLLDGDMRKLSVYRDDHALAPDPPVASEIDLTRFINAMNATGVSWASRLSPRLVTDLLEITGAWVIDVLERVDPTSPARFPVSWAGERESPQWMDTAREYTERWHHQAQIRDAVGVPRLLAPRWMRPLLDASVRALPHAYRGTPAPEGTTVTLDVRGETAGQWTVVRGHDGWRIAVGAPERPDARVTVPTDLAWRLLYNALPEPAEGVVCEGPPVLTDPMLRARSVIV